MDFKQINRLTGGFVFLFALIVYILTVQPTMSFWDCGEFLACAFTLSTPHPPGAPLHILVGKIFTMLPTAADIGLRMNYLSVLTAALSVMLLYLVSTKVIKNWRGAPANLKDSLIIAIPSAIGALSYAFADSFWFNAMEAEVYAFGTFLITLVIYIMMLWWERAEQPGSDKYLLFAAYIVGLSLGIHLLVVQCVFLMGLIFYFRRYEYTHKSFIVASGVSVLAFFVVYPFISSKMPDIIKSSPVLGFIIIVGLLLLGIIYSIQKKSKPLTFALMAVFLIITGYTTYISVMQRSGVSNLPIDENNPDNVERLLPYLNREQYGEQPLIWPRRYSQENMHQRTWKNYSGDIEFLWKYQINEMFNRYLFWQYIGRAGYDQGAGVDFSKLFGIPFIIGLIGVFHHFRRDWKLALVFLAMFVMLGVVTALYQNQQDPQPRERDYFYEGAFYVFSLWIALGVVGIIEMISEMTKKQVSMGIAGVVMAVSFVFVPLNMLKVNYPYQSRAGNYFPYDYGYNLLQSCEKDAILITNGDNDTFPLWCLQAVYGVRQDVRIINLSLAQMDWYNLQLKNERPYGSLTVPMSYTDAQLTSPDFLRPREWDEKKIQTIDVPPEAYPDTMKTKPDKIVFTVPATIRQKSGNRTITGVKFTDLLVLDVIRSSKWKRPFYFSSTVSPDNFAGLSNHLILQGMVYKLVPYSVNEGNDIAVDQEVTKKCLLEPPSVPSKTPQYGFLFRGLNDDKIFYDQTQQRMLEMYRTIFVWLANSYTADSTKLSEAKAILSRMETVISSKVVNMDYRQEYQIAMLYSAIGDRSKFEQYSKGAEAGALQDKKSKNNNTQNFYNPYRILLDIYEARGDYQKAIDILNELDQRDPAVLQKKESLKLKMSGNNK
ncbi:MAG: DUF2723 domain-containing protein [Ignavibacteria bacterium]|nr:DUF2723 domain-containing protein [Ignavibacteria bacterium]